MGKAIGENPTTHTVTFDSMGGSEIAPKEVVNGLKIKAPSTPTKDKYLFRGWYEDSTFSKEFDFNTLITSDMTLYAKWEAANSINEIRLAGDFQYGTVPVGTLPSFNPGTTTDSITIDKTNSDWVKRTSTTSLWGGFAGNTPVAYNDGKTYYGYSFCVKTNDGYQLDYSNLKVFYNEEEVTSSVKISKYAWGAYVDVDLGKAIGTPVVYTITFNSNDGTPVAPQNVNAGEKLAEPTPAPTKVGFTFDGWYEDSTFSKKFDFNTPITDSMTLYAKWTENKYTLTFDANGGSGTMAPIADLTGEYTLPSNGFIAAPHRRAFRCQKSLYKPMNWGDALCSRVFAKRRRTRRRRSRLPPRPGAAGENPTRRRNVTTRASPRAHEKGPRIESLENIERKAFQDAYGTEAMPAVAGFAQERCATQRGGPYAKAAHNASSSVMAKCCAERSGPASSHICPGRTTAMRGGCARCAASIALRKRTGNVSSSL